MDIDGSWLNDEDIAQDDKGVVLAISYGSAIRCKCRERESELILTSILENVVVGVG